MKFIRCWVSKLPGNASLTNSNKLLNHMAYMWTIGICLCWQTGCLWEDSLHPLTETESIEWRMCLFSGKQATKKLPISCLEPLYFPNGISWKVYLRRLSLGSLFRWAQTASKLWLMLTQLLTIKQKDKSIKMKPTTKLKFHTETFRMTCPREDTKTM